MMKPIPPRHLGRKLFINFLKKHNFFTQLYLIWRLVRNDNKQMYEYYSKYDQMACDSNAVLALIQQNRLVEAESAANKLLIDHPYVHDGYGRLAQIYTQRGDYPKAIEMLQNVVNFIEANYPEDEELLESYKEELTDLVNEHQAKNKKGFSGIRPQQNNPSA